MGKDETEEGHAYAKPSPKFSIIGIGWKNALVTGFSLLVVIAFGLHNFQSLLNLKDDNETHIQAHEARVEIENLRALIVNMDADLQRFLISGDQRFVASYESSRMELGQSLNLTHQLVQGMTFHTEQSPDNHMQADHLFEIENLIFDWIRDFAEPLILEQETGAASNSLRETFSQNRLDLDRIQSRIDEIVHLMNNELEYITNNDMQRTNRSGIIGLIGSLMMILFSIALYRSMQANKTQALDLEREKFRLKDQAWIKTSITSLVSDVQASRTILDASATLMNCLPPMVGAGRGAVFALQRLDRFLDGWHFQAGFALPEDNNGAQHFQPGMGIVGEVGVRGESYYLEHPNNTNDGIITAGETLTPAVLVTSPIAFEGKTLLVIELALGQPLTASQKEFLDQACSVLGPIFHSIYATSQTEHLLEQANTYAERLQERQLELEIAKGEAEEANATKSDFLATISHEIRTPMNGIMGISQLLKKSELTDDQREKIDSLLASGHSMLSLLNDVLDFSKIEKGHVVLDPVHFNLRDNFYSLTNTFKELASEKGVGFEVDFKNDHDQVIYADDGRIRQIVWNLISNAIKFTNNGKVALTIDAAPGPVGNDNTRSIDIRISVKDTGIGIAKDKQAAIFEAFEQADNTTTRKFGGTGLGLAIVTNLVDLMDGRITLESEPGTGSTFTVVLRVTEGDPNQVIDHSTERTLRPDETRHAQSLRILVAEDQPLNATIAKTFLAEMGHKVDVVENGELALEAVKSVAYDLVMMDNHMPVMTGGEATEKIRDLEDKTLANIPIVGLTADAFTNSQTALLEAGMNEILLKPIDEKSLFNCVSRYLQQNSQIRGLKEEQISKILYTSTPEKLADPEDFHIFDKDQLESLKNVMGEIAFTDFLDAAVETLDEISSDLRRLNGPHGLSDETIIAFHSLKGIAAQVGAKRLATVAEHAEEVSKTSQVDEDTLVDVQKHVIEVIPLITEYRNYYKAS